MSELGRRTFVVTTLASGFALAVSPVAAQTITTDAGGLLAGEIKIGAMPAYRAQPETGAKFPLILVVPEIFGVHEHIKDLCRRLAKAGYMAIAPEVFARQGDPTKMTDIQKIFTDVVDKTPDDQVMKDLDATVEWAQRSGKLDGNRVGITGFCWGGRITWLYAARGGPAGTPKAAVAWYGRLSNATNALQTKTVIDIGSKLKAPVLGLYGGQDSGIPLAHIEMMRREIAASTPRNASEIVVYADAGHAFNADYRPSYKKADADDAWQKMLAWMKKNGV
ncbi:MAG TPA: dienelactone hydrolase family protein [Labilithrix sp.]|nr:dienelactone hydrolase family protein [Labilithrix sp.]